MIITKKEVQNFIDTIKEIRNEFSDSQALLNIKYFPSWKPNQYYTTGMRIQYNNNLYRVITDHTSIIDLSPEDQPLYYVKIILEEV